MCLDSCLVSSADIHRSIESMWKNTIVVGYLDNSSVLFKEYVVISLVSSRCCCVLPNRKAVPLSKST